MIRQKDVFVNFAINLFQYGVAYLGKMHIKPSQATRNIKAGALGDMSQVDWVVLASLRDSQNSMLRYDQKSDKISGITYPYEVEAWCQQIGFRQVINKTNLIFSKGIDNLMQAQQCLMSGYSVCLLINLNILISNNPNTPSYFPNHWVVLTSNIVVDGLPINPSSSKKLVKERIDYYSDTYDVNSDLVYGETFNHDIKFKVYSWGMRNRPLGAIQNGSVDLTTFLNYYYGFVAAKSLKL